MQRKVILAAVAAVLLAVGVVVAADPFGSVSEPDAWTPSAVQSAPRLQAGLGLCAARAKLAAGNHLGAYDLFYTQAHTGLHEVAARLDDGSENGKAVSASLRVAKSKVEQQFNIAGSASLAARLDELIVELNGKSVGQSCPTR